jgi:hypothetical protein
MNSLRRDLLERKLWPVVAILVLAIVAVPFVLRKNASADVTVAPAPHAAVGTAPADRAADAARMHALEVSLPRDPFASGMPKLNAKPASQTKSSSSTGASSSSSSPAGTAASSTSSPASMVSPSPVTSSSGSSSGASAGTGSTPGTGSPASTASTGGSTVTTTTTVTVPSTTLPGNQWAVAAADPSWTIFSAALRFGADGNVPIRSDVARLTPLPSVAHPRVMFMGVLDGGEQAVFALGAGVQHAGPGLCRPNRARCAAIVLSTGQTERIIVPGASGSQQQLKLTLASISSQVTHSRRDALAAYDRHSAAGLCELDLADPVTYSQTDGTLATVAAASDCKGQKRTVPFPGSLIAP